MEIQILGFGPLPEEWQDICKVKMANGVKVVGVPRRSVQDEILRNTHGTQIVVSSTEYCYWRAK